MKGLPAEPNPERALTVLIDGIDKTLEVTRECICRPVQTTEACPGPDP